MSAIPEDLRENVVCSICLKICKSPYRLPCEHFFCREPCLQALLHAEPSTCPNCRLAFSEADMEPFRLHSNIVDLMQKSPEVATQQEGQTAICPICVRLVEAPLRMSEHFSELVCGDCWSTGETLHKLVLDDDREQQDSWVISGREEVAAQNNQTDEGAICPICVRLVGAPLWVSEHFSELVCGDCWSSGETLRKLVLDEAREEADNLEVISRSEEFAVQSNQQTEGETCAFCHQLVERPAHMLGLHSRPVCYDCLLKADTRDCTPMDRPDCSFRDTQTEADHTDSKNTPNSHRRTKTKADSKDAKISLPKGLFRRLLCHKSQK